MGVYYYVADKRNKTLFELNKGLWFEINDKERVDFEQHIKGQSFTKAEFKEYIDKWFDDTPYRDFVWKAFNDWSDENTFYLINDCSDSDIYLEENYNYKETGTRFEKP